MTRQIACPGKGGEGAARALDSTLVRRFCSLSFHRLSAIARSTQI